LSDLGRTSRPAEQGWLAFLAQFSFRPCPVPPLPE
jgi:hypothetical protein